MNHLISTLRNIDTTTFTEQYFRTLEVGTSDCNEYIPVYSLIAHNLLVISDEIRVLEYNMPNSDMLASLVTNVRTYSSVINYLLNSVTPVIFNFKVAGVPQEVFLYKGIAYNRDGKILACLAINTQYLFGVDNLDQFKATPDASKFIIVTTDTLDLEIYKNFKKKLYEVYITPLLDLGVDLVLTRKPQDWLFKNNVEPEKFKSAIELRRHLKDVPKKILEL